jgi:hypothetical protein
MANQRTRSWRQRLIGLGTSAALLASIGCGMHHGRYQGDPMLGSFNRPIAPTPPIFTGGDPGFSPAYDGGAHIGLPSPDVPAKSNQSLERMFIVPTYQGSLGVSRLFNGGTSGGAATTPGSGLQRVGGKDTTPKVQRKPATPNVVGAHLLRGDPGPSVAPAMATAPVAAPANANTVTARPNDVSTLLTHGSAIEPVAAPAQQLSATALMKDPREIVSVQEGQTILQACGAKAQVMEQQPTGEWRYICTIGRGEELRRYEARSNDQLDAVRAVMYQIKKEQ